MQFLPSVPSADDEPELYMDLEEPLYNTRNEHDQRWDLGDGDGDGTGVYGVVLDVGVSCGFFLRFEIGLVGELAWEERKRGLASHLIFEVVFGSLELYRKGV